MTEVALGTLAGLGCPGEGLKWVWGVLGGIGVGLGWDWGGIHPWGVLGWNWGVLGWDLGVPGWAPLCALPSAPYLGGRRADVSQQLVHVPVVLEAPKNQGNLGFGTFCGHWGAGTGTERCHSPAPQLQGVLEASLVHGRGDVLGLGAQRGIGVSWVGLGYPGMKSGCPRQDWTVLGGIGMDWGVLVWDPSLGWVWGHSLEDLGTFQVWEPSLGWVWSHL